MPELSDYAALGDGRSLALVSKAGSVDWLAWPRFDAPAVFSSLTNPAHGGSFAINPQNVRRVARMYAENTNVLTTTFTTETGTLSSCDLLAIATPEDARQRLLPENALLRRIECTAGHVVVDVSYAPRPEGGAIRPRLRDERALGIRFAHKGQLYALHTTAKLIIREDGTAVARLIVRLGESVDFVLTSHADTPTIIPPLRAYALETIERTCNAWRPFAQCVTYEGPYKDLVVRSALITKMLLFAPTGALVENATTAHVRGRVRGADLTTDTLVRLGCVSEARAYVDWLAEACSFRQQRLHDSFALDGNSDTHAAPHVLALHAEVTDACAKLAEHDGHVDHDMHRLMRELGAFLATQWDTRDVPLHSQILTWRALTRLLSLKIRGILPKLETTQIHQARDALAARLSESAFQPDLGAYPETLNGATVAATSLLLPRNHWDDASSPRMRSTFEVIQARLLAAPGLLYRDESSRAAGEGVYVPASFWLGDFLARGGGSVTQAHTQFVRGTRLANDVGLFANEVEPTTGAFKGAFPNASAHIAFLSTALTMLKHTGQAELPATQHIAAAANDQSANEDAEAQRPKRRRGKRKPTR